MAKTLTSTDWPAVLVRHSCCNEGNYPSRDHWLKAFDSAGARLSHLVDLPRLNLQTVEVLQRDEGGDWLVVDEIDARPEIYDTTVKPIAFELALGVIRGIVSRRSDCDIFVTICHPHFLTSNTKVRELEMATRLADEGHRLYALISCQSEHISFGQALASSGGYELFRTTSIDGPVSRLVARSRHKEAF